MENSDGIQLSNDIDLLKLMMADLSRAEAIYKATSYWAYYEPLIVNELIKVGLKNFRRRQSSNSHAFTYSETRPLWWQVNLDGFRILSNKYSRQIPGWRNWLHFLSASISKFLGALPSFYAYNASLEDLQLLTYEYVKSMGSQRGAKPITYLETSLFGNPEDLFYVENKPYTVPFLKYYWRYSFAAQYVNFDEAKIYVELGSGAGEQAEVISKLHPNMAILLFDIPPQIYVAEQYLRSVFPDRVVSYRETRDIQNLKSIEAGKIYIFPNWKIPILKGNNIDLFWNARSLSETEPEVMASYLEIVINCAQHIYLNQILGGATLQGAQSGPGVEKRIHWEDYEDLLAPSYQLLERSPALYPSSPTSTLRAYNKYADEGFWTRK